MKNRFKELKEISEKNSGNIQFCYHCIQKHYFGIIPKPKLNGLGFERFLKYINSLTENQTHKGLKIKL